jgi:hypothetical protein
MKKSTKFLSLCILMLIATVIPVSAQNVTLDWDQNTEPEVVGYKIYYRTDTPTFPFNGTSLSEGASPIAVDGSANTSLPIDLPDDGNVYYFTTTAVTDAGIESSVSNIVASEWIPYLLAPDNNTVIDTAVTFVWDLPPESYNVSFNLLYGTDRNLDTNAMSVTGHGTLNSNWPQFKLSIALLMALLLPMLVVTRPDRAKRAWHPVRVGLCIGIFVLQASCGGSGGGGDDTGVLVGTDIPGTSVSGTSVPDTSVPDTSVPDTSVPDTSVPDTSVPDTSVPDTSVPVTGAPAPSETLFADVVTDINDTEYQLTDLKPDTQYYWKIVAVDNWGNSYESLTKTFKTLSN